MNRLIVLMLLSALPSTAGAADFVPVKSVVLLRLLYEADAPAQERGVITAIKVREGDAVAKGDLLAQLDDRQTRIAERAAQIEVAIAAQRAGNDVNVRYAAKAREVAEAELQRSEESIRSFPKSVSQSQLDVERLSVDKIILEKEQAEHDLKLASLEERLRDSELTAARLARQQRQIVAPLDGVVVEVAARLGEWLEPGQQAFRLVNVERLKAEGFILADDAQRISPGDAVKLTTRTTSGEQVFPGELVFVSPEIDPINDQVRVWAEIDNASGRLRPGQRAEMTIARGSQDAHAVSRKSPRTE